MHPENAIDNGDFIKILVYKFILFQAYNVLTIHPIQLIMLFIWSCIEVVITGRTRNAFALRGTRVRIPPTPLSGRSRYLYLFRLFACFSCLPFRMSLFFFC